MSRSLIMAVPVALALFVSGCATNAPSNQIAPNPNVGAGVGNAPGAPVSPNTPQEITGSLTNTEAQATPARATRRSTVRRTPVNNRSGFGGSGRAPVPGGELGNPGS